MVDLCAGSGAIALAIADEVPRRACTRSSSSRTRWPGRAATCRRTGLPVTLHAGDVADPPAARRRWTGRWTWSTATRRTSRSGAAVEPRGRRARPAGRAVGRRGRAGRRPGGRAGGGAAAAAGRPGRGRARRPAGRVGAGRVRPGLGGRGGPSRPGRAAALHHRAGAEPRRRWGRAGQNVKRVDRLALALGMARSGESARAGARHGTARHSGAGRRAAAPQGTNGRRPRLRAATRRPGCRPGAAGGTAAPRARRPAAPGPARTAAGGVRPARGGEQLDQPRLHISSTGRRTRTSPAGRLPSSGRPVASVTSASSRQRRSTSRWAPSTSGSDRPSRTTSASTGPR